MKLKKEFTNIKGERTHIRNHSFKNMDELKLFLINSERQSTEERHDEFEAPQGFDTYESPYDENSAFKIYLEAFYNPRFNAYGEDNIISKLQSREKALILTDVPKGIITIGNRIIGQEIPKHKGYVPFQSVDFSGLELIETYYRIIEVLEELLDNNIIYTDIRPNNFLINKSGRTKLINFEKFKVWFKDDGYHNVHTLIENLKLMITILNKQNGLSELASYKDADNLEEIKKRVKQSMTLLKK